VRIASLLPSATDIVVALGAGDELVGVSHSCGATWSHLPARTSTRLDLTASSLDIDTEVKTAGSPLYDLDVARLEQLAPDVVVSQSLCDVCAVASGDVEDAVRNLSSKNPA
jgi:iron complex transport system substrate-binding protein